MPIAAERRELVEQRLRINDGPAPDEKLDVRDASPPTERSAAPALAIADDDRVAGVIAAAESRDDVVIGGVEIDDAAFALVAPLKPEDDIGSGNRESLFRRNSRSLGIAHRDWGDAFELRHHKLGEERVGPAEVAPRELLRIIGIERLVQQMIAGIAGEKLFENVLFLGPDVAVMPSTISASGQIQWSGV